MSGKPIPAAHSMIALFGAPIIRYAKYAPAGTKELAGLALEALDQSHAVLLSNYCTSQRWRLEAALIRAQELGRSAGFMQSPFPSVGRPYFQMREVGRISERLKSNGADIQAARCSAC